CERQPGGIATRETVGESAGAGFFIDSGDFSTSSHRSRLLPIIAASREDDLEEIQQSVDAARRRLVIRQWAGRLAVCLTAAFCVALLAILAPKLFVVPNLPPGWAALWLGGAGIVGVVAASIWTALRSKTRLEAAAEIDHRYDLRERI